MPKIPSIAIVDEIDNCLYIWHVSTEEVSFKGSRLAGAWNFNSFTFYDIDNLISDRHQYITKSAEKVLKRLSIPESNTIDVKGTLRRVNEKISVLKSILEQEQARRKSYLQLVEPFWPEFESDFNIDPIVKADKNNTIRTLLIARWFESLFKRWERIEEIRLGSLFLRKSTSLNFTPLEIINKN